MSDLNLNPSSESTTPARKPYQKLDLIVYGDVGALTLSQGVNGAADSGGIGLNMFSSL